MIPITDVAWSAPEQARSNTPLVVALHGRGATEESMLGLAPYLPTNCTMAALRAPIAEGGGYAWFANRGIGRPVEESIKAVAEGVFAWLATVREQHTHVVLLGFSGGTAMAGGLLLADPTAFDGSVLLSGTLPWDAGFDTSPGRLAQRHVFWGNDPADAVVPRELMDRSEAWLINESGADLEVHHYEGLGHGIAVTELDDVSRFITAITSGA